MDYFIGSTDQYNMATIVFEYVWRSDGIRAFDSNEFEIGIFLFLKNLGIGIVDDRVVLQTIFKVSWYF